MSERVVECSFLVPIVGDTDRKLHSPIAWRLLQDAIHRLFKGLSGPERFLLVRDVELVPGSYTEEATGNRVHDESRRYTVAIPEGQSETLRGLLRKAANTFDQKCIYLSVAGEVEFVTAKPEDGYLE
jgi:hypothetical protein